MADKLTLDKGAMKDRTTAHLRIYVGGLTDKATIDGIYEHFQAFGQINGIAINKGFGFVQFEHESSVQEAINKANGSVYEGKSLNVRPAVTTDKRKDEGPHQPAGPYAGHQDNLTDHGGEEEDYGEEDYSEEGFGGRVRARGPRVRTRPRGRGRGATPAAVGFRDRSPMARGPKWLDRDPYAAAPGYPRPLPITDRNDCEIIVVSKTLTEYAEYIEGRLKQLGIVVDLLYPMEDVPLGKVLGNIASRGCLYAILVMPVNMQRRSLTLSILHGLPQEHRNMPVDDAMSLLARNFEDVKRSSSAANREAVFALLGQLADGRTLTAAQYQHVIDYLKERWEKQNKLEQGELNPTTPAVKVEDVLQKRILSILNEKKIASKDIAPPIPPPAPAAPAPPKPALLQDPTVRKALDSILQKFV